MSRLMHEMEGREKRTGFTAPLGLHVLYNTVRHSNKRTPTQNSEYNRFHGKLHAARKDHMGVFGV